MKAEWRVGEVVYLGKGIPVVLQVCIIIVHSYDQIFNIHFFAFLYTTGLPWVSYQMSE